MHRAAVLLLMAALGALPGGAPAIAAREDPIDLVDPMIGTLGSGFVFPGPAAPYGMVQLSPDTEGIFAYTGYQYIDRTIRGFSHVHTQSIGVPEGGDVPFMPTVGDVSTNVLEYQTPFSHALEVAKPGYYRVDLPGPGIRAELTAGLRVGMHRYTFPRTPKAHVLIDAGRQIDGGRMIPTFEDPDFTQSIPGTNLAVLRIVDGRTIAGSTNIDLRAAQHYSVHFVARFDRPFAAAGVWSSRGAPLAPASPGGTITGDGAGAVAGFDAREDTDVVVKVGISFVSQANALENLEAELPGEDFGFDALRNRTRNAWRHALGAITVSGGTLPDRISFYTALYNAQHHPNVFNDSDGEYLGHDGGVHSVGETGGPLPAGSTYYANFSLWDTYRGEVQLLALIAPDRTKDMVRSLLAIAQQGGRLPKWAHMNRYPDYMQGDPAMIMLADAWCRGLVPGDIEDALYAAARRDAFDQPRDPARMTLGYLPGNPSGTLEHALGDFAFALIADRLGHAGDRDRALGLAGTWRNVFDPETRFMRPRDESGWATPYLPESPEGWVEGTGWQYTWLVPHDVRTLFDAIGAPPNHGDATVQTRLDEFFAFPATATVPLLMPEIQQKITLYGIAYAGNQYAPSNEHDLHAPYLYDWTYEPWKTQALVRAYQGLYRAAPDGLPGNDDLGTMSAWLVWADLGFYPAVGGAPGYAIGSPLFDRAEIRVPGGVVTVHAPGASATSKYIWRTQIGRRALGTWFPHRALTAGTTIDFEMSRHPNFGTLRLPLRSPPSLTTDGVEGFGCRV